MIAWLALGRLAVGQVTKSASLGEKISTNPKGIAMMVDKHVK
jgi:hypothetical protein